MEMLSKKWVLMLINALLVIGFGIILLLVPIKILESFVFIIGTVIAFVGLVLIFGAFNYTKENKSMVIWLFQGLFNMAIGGIVMFFPEASIKFLLILAGLWAIVLGVYQFSFGLISELEIKGKTGHKINGFAAMVIGLLLIFTPELIVGLMIIVFGFLLLVIGGGMIYFALHLRRLGQNTYQNDDDEIINIDSTMDDEITP
jgi:uncharacterized membrane protein HdeD (DUF308 family)